MRPPAAREGRPGEPPRAGRLYPHRPSAPCGILVALVATLGALAALPACQRTPRSPEEAYRRFSAAVREQDGASLFQALDQETRWSWMTIHRSQVKAYETVLARFPAEAQGRTLRRFEAAAGAADARQMFAAEALALWPDLAPLAAEPASVRIQTEGPRATVTLPSGKELMFRRGEDGSWGYAGLSEDAEGRKVRTVHDLELVEASAADYDRAGTASSGR